MSEQSKFERQVGTSQTIEELAALARDNSGYKRQALENGRDKLFSPEGQALFLDRVTDPEDPVLGEIDLRQVEIYGEDEATGQDWMRVSLQRKNPDLYDVTRSERGEFRDYSHAEYLLLGGRKAALYFCYVDAGKDALKLAFVENLYVKAAAYAKERGEEIAMVVIEADEGWAWCEKAGLKLPCLKKTDGTIAEVPYFAPSMAWDPKTGEGLFREIPNHLKVWQPGEKPDTQDFLATIRAMYDQFVKYDEFETNKARANAEASVDALFAKLSKEMEGGELVLLTEAECQGLGDKFIGHSAVEEDNE